MNQIDLKPQVSQLYLLTDFINGMLPKENLDVTLIIEEIFVNIVNYSNTDFIRVNAELNDDILTMEFIDGGTEFNPLLKKVEEVPNNIDDAKIGGLGILLTKKIADDVEYERLDDENHLIIIKKVK